MKLYLSLICMFFSLLVFGQISFQEKATELGIDFSCGTTYIGNGVTFFDADGDGWDDLTFATADSENIQFFKNINGSFVLHSLSGVSVNYQTKQINWVDFDNDGDKDLFVTSDQDLNRLFENQGDFTFIDITEAAGFPNFSFFTYGASWGDYNNDGFLDVFLTNRDETVLTTTPNFLYRNNGDGTFTDVSVEAGFDSDKHLSFCSAFIDYDKDGWQDIYVSNDKLVHYNLMYHNNGDGTFTEVGEATGTNVLIDAMTVTVGDFDNDSWFDIYVTNLGPSAFLKNNGDGTFTDVAESTGTEFNSTGWGAAFLDGDNDTDIDLYVSGSLYNHPIYPSAAFYENMNDGTFTEPENAGFDDDEGYSHSNAIGDINNDGLADFAVTNTNDQNVFLWENTNTENNNWIKINLEGTTSNRDGIGSTIELSCAGNVMYRYTHCGEGYLSQNSGTEFFGLGNGTNIEYLKVKWLSGIEDVFFNVSVNQVLNVVEGSSLSVNEFNSIDVSLTPNPVNSIFKLNSNTIISEIAIYNTLMQRIYSNSENALNFTIDVSEFQSGVYFLQLNAEGREKTIRFIKE
ncbi:FG-GAP-like repeat-containing protein [Ichthyenterobacterium sp. W332]|uniref:FG-GAP-like repeat-containing protein n=1 Tax=Microcosmobacter mediterraneus TaxID=3075607 RepID=A0ABU2YIE2_9FLAO|nr:FG-GAP-like repeat-containing protein [Ichthyenterobacterium sp. W332]MDT0557949.1 FG-GAP-like repeat-containing protein [Ichthyenterobacterium sp. W332]